MKKINCNGWAPCSKPVPYEKSGLTLITNRNNLYYNFHTYNAGGVARVYYNLCEPIITYHYFYENN